MTDVRKAREAEIEAAIVDYSNKSAPSNTVMRSGDDTLRTYYAGFDLSGLAKHLATLSTLPSEEVGEEEIAKIISDELTLHKQGLDYEDPDGPIQRAARAILSRLSLRSGVEAPQDWKLVPIEPTAEMIAAAKAPYVHGIDETMHKAFCETIAEYWRVMLATAPMPLPSTPSHQKG